MYRFLLICVLAGSLLIAVAAILAWFRHDPEQQLPAARVDHVAVARRALQRGDLDAAEDVISRALSSEPADSGALLMAAELAIRRQDFARAVTWLEAIPASANADYISAQFTLGEVARSRGSLQQAEEYYDVAVRSDPDFSTGHLRLAFIKRLTGRPRAAQVHLQRLLELRALPPEQLAWLADPEQVPNAEDFLEGCREAAPNDPYPLFGLGTLKLSRGDHAGAEVLLLRGLEIADDIEVRASLGRCLIERNDVDRLNAWLRGLSPADAQAPEISFVLGVILERRGNLGSALNRFADCLAAWPHHRSAMHHFGTLLNREGRIGAAAVVLEKVQLLTRLHSVVESIDPANPGRRPAAEASSLLLELGRTAEAQVWAGLAGLPPPAPSDQSPSAMAQLAAIVSEYAGRDSEVTVAPSSSPVVPDRQRQSRFHFVDEAHQRGIDFQYFESPNPSEEGRRMFEFPGGGVGVLDFDVDGRPDLYFTQGTTWPPETDDGQYRDVLYRQRPHGAFERVDAQAGLREVGFSHGVAVGDLDNDGFPDLYVANFGTNQCFRNNGDGTFMSWEDPTIAQQDSWTTSCVIADLDGDAVADIFDVNYVEGPDVETRRCSTPNGPRVCTPLAFTPARNRLLLADGAGGFADSTATAGLSHPGNGLGILVASLDDDPELEIFVANDLMENALWDWSLDSGVAVYEDVALTRGWALSSEGDAQACMGVAAADLDGDGDTDLFITNFFNEPNNLYLQESDGLTQDRASEFGLRSPSLPMLGFGTQPLDADCDGNWDLVVANGDLDDFAHEGRPLAMRPQLFENLDNHQFAELTDERRSGYFSGVFRGRGLARLDWNGDGLADFAVSHLDTPSALVTNRSASLGAFLSVRLVGTNSSRDAVGAIVRLRQNDRTWSQQLTAGDGYQASNERVMLFGGLTVKAVAGMEITWPSGLVDRWADLESDHHYTAIEGEGIYELPSRSAE